MAQTTDHDVPRFIFHVQKNSELLPHLVELERNATRKSWLSHLWLQPSMTMTISTMAIWCNYLMT